MEPKLRHYELWGSPWPGFSGGDVLVNITSIIRPRAYRKENAAVDRLWKPIRFLGSRGEAPFMPSSSALPGPATASPPAQDVRSAGARPRSQQGRSWSRRRTQRVSFRRQED